MTHNWMPSISLQFQNWAIHTLPNIPWFSASDVWKYIGIASSSGQVLYCFLFRLKLTVFVINTPCLEKQTYGKYACNYHVKSCNHRKAYPLMNPFMLLGGKWNLIHEFLSVFFSEDVFYHLKSAICVRYLDIVVKRLAELWMFMLLTNWNHDL